MHFWKGHALGNDYIILDRTGADPPQPALVRALCDRHRGVGGDGVLVADRSSAPIRLRIFNPDGSEAEKSGNGLRIFGAWLHGQGLVETEVPFEVALPAETVEMRVESEGGTRGPMGGTPLVLRVAMGRASFRAGAIPFTAVDPDSAVQGRALDLDGETVQVHLVSLGNPHCVIFVDDLDAAPFRRQAPRVQAHPAFERGVNVQFARSPAPGVLEAYIWERGAGETLASGSSACAVAAAARRAGIVTGDRFEVRMPGGSVRVEIDAEWRVRLTGEAGIVFEGETVG